MKVNFVNGQLQKTEESFVSSKNKSLVISSQVKEPICISHNIHNFSESYTVNLMVQSGARLTLLDEFLGEVSKTTLKTKELKNQKKIPVITYNIHLEPFSQVDFLLTPHSVFKRKAYSRIEEGGSLEVVKTFLKQEEDSIDLDLHLCGPKAEAFLKGIYFSDKKNKNSIQANVEHHEPCTYSHLIYKGILDDQSQVQYRGCVVIHKKAQESNSSQLNKNILLSDQARINSQPELKVFADNVKATHGSTVGEMSQEELFYFQSRGINKELAKKILLKGFLKDVAMGIRNKGLSQIVISHVEEVIS